MQSVELAREPKEIKKLRIKSLLKESWAAVYGVKGTFFLAFLIYVISYAITNMILYFTHNNILLSIIFSIFLNLLASGLVYLGLRRAYSMSLSAKKIFYPFKFSLAIKIIVAQFLTAVILVISIGFLPLIFLLFTSTGQNYLNNFLIATGLTVGILIAFYLAVRLAFTTILILAQHIGPFKAIAYSFKLTRSNFWRLLLLLIFSLLIAFASILTFGIALIWTFPFLLILWALAYKKLVDDLLMR